MKKTIKRRAGIYLNFAKIDADFENSINEFAERMHVKETIAMQMILKAGINLYNSNEVEFFNYLRIK